MDRLCIFSVRVREQGIHRQRARKRNRRRTCERKLAQMQQRVAIAGLWSRFFFYLCAFSLKGRCSSESMNAESLSCIRTHTHTHTHAMHACKAMPDLQGKAERHSCRPCSRLLPCLTAFLAAGPDDDHASPEHQDRVSSELGDSQLQLSSSMLLRCSRFYYSSCG